MRKAVLLFTAICAPLAAQDAAFEGTAVNSITGESLSGVHVTLFSFTEEGIQKAFGAISDKAGHFSISPIPSGNYILMTQRTGFVYFRPKDSAAAIGSVSLKPGQKLTDYKVTMAQEAVVSGRVVDEKGEPLPGSEIDLQPASPDTPPDIFRMGMDSRADYLGEFRVAAAPGKYYVLAKGLQSYSPGSLSNIGEGYYPGVADKARATVVDAVAGRETSGIEIRIPAPGRKFSLEGTVTGMTGNESPNSVRVHLLSGRENQSSEDSRFTFFGLDPGTYKLYASVGTGNNRLRSPVMEVRIDAADIANLQVHLQRVSPLTGTVEIAGLPISATAPSPKRSVVFDPVGQGVYAAEMSRAETDAASAFHMDTPMPGKYRVTVEPMPENGYLQSIDVDGAKIASDEIDLTTASLSPRIKIVISPNAASVSGKVLDKDGQPIGQGFFMALCVAQGQELHLADTPEQTGPDGSYRVHGLRPGKYNLFAVDALEFAGPNAEEAIKQLAAKADVVEIKEGDKLTKDIKVIHRGSADDKPKQ